MEDMIEMRLLRAIRGLLTERVNELLSELPFHFPLIEFRDHAGRYAVNPKITFNTCERTEKERIILMDAYTLTITFTVPETEDSELFCYVYSTAVDKAINEDVTLSGIADRAVVTGKKYIPPKKSGCGEEWQVTISLRVTVEN